LIVVGAFASGLRALGSGLASSPEQILAVAFIGGIGFAFTYVGTVTWLAGAVPRSVQATAQGIFTGTAVSIGAIAGSILGGSIGGALGLAALFLIAAAGYGLGGVLAWFAIVRRPVRVER
jgi:MFS family permease